MSAKKIEISSVALVKLQLHLAKYPHCAVNGILLACKQKLADEQVLSFVDVIPLFHHSLQLTPMLEIALTNVDAHCSEKDLFIAGYYEAPEQLNVKVEPSPFSLKIAEKIKSNSPDSRLVIVDNRKIPGLESLNFYSADSTGKKWSKANDEVICDTNAVGALQDLLQRKAYRDLVDFDNHLNDISLHWLNQPLNRLIQMT